MACGSGAGVQRMQFLEVARVDGYPSTPSLYRRRNREIEIDCLPSQRHTGPEKSEPEP